MALFPNLGSLRKNHEKRFLEKGLRALRLIRTLLASENSARREFQVKAQSQIRILGAIEPQLSSNGVGRKG